MILGPSTVPACCRNQQGQPARAARDGECSWFMNGKGIPNANGMQTNCRIHHATSHLQIQSVNNLPMPYKMYSMLYQLPHQEMGLGVCMLYEQRERLMKGDLQGQKLQEVCPAHPDAALCCRL